MKYIKSKFKLYTDHQYNLKMRTATPIEKENYEKGEYDSNTHEKGEGCFFIFEEGKSLMVATYQPRKKMVLQQYLGLKSNHYEFANRKELTKQELRDLCKAHPNYGIKVDCGEVWGIVKDMPVKVDNLGKWLFGVGAYKGHINVDNDTIIVHGEVPIEAIEMVREVLYCKHFLKKS